MRLLSRLIGFNLIVILVFGLFGLSGRMSQFLDLPGIVLVLGLLLGGLLLSFRPAQIVQAIGLGIAGDLAEPVSPTQRRACAAVFGRAYQLSWGAGLVATLTGLIAMLADLSDPGAIGVGMSVALLTTVYGALLAEFLFAPLQQSVLNLPTDAERAGLTHEVEEPIAGGPPSGLWRGVAVVALLIAVFLVPIVSFSEVKKEAYLRPDEESQYMRYMYGHPGTGAPAAQLRMDDPVE